MNSICVFCGSSTGRNPRHADAARHVGTLFGQRGIQLVYGGGSVGLMGLLADAALAAGGQVVGVIPHALWEREVGHRGLTDTRIVDTMHERKALMADLSDAFVALPGGAGTLEELFEAWTWAQLGIHAKPVGILNVGGYFSPLLAFLENAVRAGFLHRRYADMLLVSEDPEDLLGRLGAYEAPSVPQWLTRGQE